MEKSFFLGTSTTLFSPSLSHSHTYTLAPTLTLAHLQNVCSNGRSSSLSIDNDRNGQSERINRHLLQAKSKNQNYYYYEGEKSAHLYGCESIRCADNNVAKCCMNWRQTEQNNNSNNNEKIEWDVIFGVLMLLCVSEILVECSGTKSRIEIYAPRYVYSHPHRTTIVK